MTTVLIRSVVRNFARQARDIAGHMHVVITSPLMRSSSAMARSQDCSTTAMASWHTSALSYVRCGEDRQKKRRSVAPRKSGRVKGWKTSWIVGWKENDPTDQQVIFDTLASIGALVYKDIMLWGEFS